MQNIKYANNYGFLYVITSINVKIPFKLFYMFKKCLKFKQFQLGNLFAIRELFY